MLIAIVTVCLLSTGDCADIPSNPTFETEEQCLEFLDEFPIQVFLGLKYGMREGVDYTVKEQKCQDITSSVL